MPEELAMPVNQELMQKLIDRYGKKKGREIYYRMESKGHKATKPSAIRKAMKGD